MTVLRLAIRILHVELQRSDNGQVNSQNVHLYLLFACHMCRYTSVYISFDFISVHSLVSTVY